MRLTRAFSLVELMIVMAIVGVLAAIAVPNYNNYKTRVVVTNVMEAARGPIEEQKKYYDIHGVFASRSQLNLPGTGGGCESCVEPSYFGNLSQYVVSAFMTTACNGKVLGF